MTSQTRVKDESDTDSAKGRGETDPNTSSNAADQERFNALIANAKVSKDLTLEKLTYIHDMLVELRKLSNSIGQPMVAYLIEMALIEADTALHVRRFGDEIGGGDANGD